MKRFTIPAAIAGFIALALLVAASGAREVGAAVAGAGWGAAIVILVRAATVALAGAGWFVLFPMPARPRLTVCMLLRFVREGINMLLPVAQVGGDVVGARLLTLFRVEGALAGASVVVDVMVQAGTQFLFTALGLGILIALGGDETVIRVVAVGLCLTAPGLVGFYLVQRSAGHRLVQALLSRLAGDRPWRALGTIEALYRRLATVYGDRSRLAKSVVVHLAAWFLGAVEVWAALWFMGYPVSYAEALVIESLAQAVRGAAFAVPGALGVQEGGLIVLCGLFGVPAEAALALSLVKRAADVLVGLPGLLVWQGLESGRLWRGPKHPAGSEGRGPDGASRVGPSALRGAILADGGLPRPDIRALQ